MRLEKIRSNPNNYVFVNEDADGLTATVAATLWSKT